MEHRTSLLLINGKPLLVLPELAKLIGINEALFLQQVHYWLTTSPHEKDGKKWVYNSYTEWRKQFPFWSYATIKRTVQKLEKLGLLISGSYNKLSIDRTKWYSIDYEALNALAQQIPITSAECADHATIVPSPLPEITTETNSNIPGRSEISKEDNGVQVSCGDTEGIKEAPASFLKENKAEPQKETSATKDASYQQYIEKRQEWTANLRRIPIRDIADKLNIPVSRDGKILCPHGEKTPSLDVSWKQNPNKFKCFSCGKFGGPIDFVGLLQGINTDTKEGFNNACDFLSSLFGIQKPDKPTSSRQYPNEYITYLETHGLTLQEFMPFGFYSKQFGGSVGITVPTGIRYRILSAKEGEEKYRNQKGTTACVFKTKPADEGIVIVCEGEMDAISLHVRTGLTAWSSTAGANTVKPEFLTEFKETHTVFIVMDNDVNGQQGAAKWKELLGEIAQIITLPSQYHDIGDYFASGGTKETFLELLIEHAALNFAEDITLQAINSPVRM